MKTYLYNYDLLLFQYQRHVRCAWGAHLMCGRQVHDLHLPTAHDMSTPSYPFIRLALLIYSYMI